MEIDRLLDIVARGGSIKTGIDIHNKEGALLLEKDVQVKNVSTLLVIKQNGLYNLDIDPASNGGVWDKSGRPLPLTTVERSSTPEVDVSKLTDVDSRIRQITRIKKEATQKHREAKKNITKVISEIKESGGQFDVQLVADTVSDIFNFLNRNGTAFSSLTKEIFSYDDYLYSHSVNVCTIGTAILNHFNDHFSGIISNYLASISLGKSESGNADMLNFYINYQPSELRDMSMGYFLHDVGKVLIPDEILNKKGALSAEEFQIVKTHSYEKGVEILDKNGINNAIIENILSNHHSALFSREQRCYPDNKLPIELPPYVKIAKLTDIYDAMTSKRCYKDAFNPINAVTDIFRSYANKDPFLQVVLHSFVKIIGIYPPGSILTLRNGQMAYVLLSDGPVVLPCTDKEGQPLANKPDPIDLGSINAVESPQMQIDKRKPLNAPMEVIASLPPYITKLLRPEA